MLDKYHITITRKGLTLMTMDGNEPFVRLELSPKEALELLQRTYGYRDLLLAGENPAFNFATREFPCPQCQAPTHLDIQGVGWLGHCNQCGSFELNATGEVQGGQRATGKRGRR